MQIMREIALFSGKIYTAETNFTRPPVVTVATNLNSGDIPYYHPYPHHHSKCLQCETDDGESPIFTFLLRTFKTEITNGENSLGHVKNINLNLKYINKLVYTFFRVKFKKLEILLVIKKRQIPRLHTIHRIFSLYLIMYPTQNLKSPPKQNHFLNYESMQLRDKGLWNIRRFNLKI